MMSILDILKFLFTKIVPTKAIMQFLELILKIPKSLKVSVSIALAIGIIYFGYSKLYTYEINGLQTEVASLRSVLDNSVKQDDYANDIYLLTVAISICEQINKYAYQEEQLQLKLIKSHIKRYYPNDDAILYDIDAMMERNDFNYEHYSAEFKQAIQKCKNGKTKKNK